MGMLRGWLALCFLSVASAVAQEVCQPVPVYTPCDIIFELDAKEKAAHPNPYVTVRLRAELRSPRHRTIPQSAFWDGGGRMVIRFAPVEAGDWEFRLTSNLSRFDGKLGKVSATEADVPGFIKPANGHHWRYTHNRQPHLWMGDTSYGLGFLEPQQFNELLDARAKQGFTHIRGYAIGRDSYKGSTFKEDSPDVAFYQRLEQRVRAMNERGIFFDAILGHDRNHLRELFPTRQARERYLGYIVSRLAAFHVTWQIVQEFEEYEDGRELLKELGTLLKNLDPYGHPRSTHAVTTSSPLTPDGWMDYRVYQSSDDQLGAIEHQLYAMPAVNAEFAYEDSGAGKTHKHHVDSNTFRKRLWNATMNGQYPTFGNTGTYGAGAAIQNAKYLESPGAAVMGIWKDFMLKTRYWELEPYFDLDGGRAIGLPGIEYIVYVENPSGPVEVRFAEKRGYDVRWLNPSTGELKPLKSFRGERLVVDPPDTQQDWVLHISADGRKEGMLRSYKFESRPFLMQEVEMSASKAPFEVAQPAQDPVSISKPPVFAVKAKRESRGTRSMMFLWTGDVATTNLGTRVLGTGHDGTLNIPKQFAPGTMNLRVYGMNALGKVYAVDRIFQVAP